MVRLRLTPEDARFRDEFRAFLRAEIPREIRDKVAAHEELTREDYVRSQRALNAAGLAVPAWPVEWGGHGWTPLRTHIWHEELAEAAVPHPLEFNTSMVGPVIAAFGSQEQKERFLPPTANLDIWWSQGFSEPEAGSDLASLRTTAVRDGRHWIVNGQKTWTTHAQYGDWIFTLVRTDPRAPKRQQGISFLLVDMSSPGVAVRPIELVDGTFEVNEVFFDDVRVPADNLVGEVNKGWTYAKFLLGNERTGLSGVGETKRMLATAKHHAHTLGLLEDASYTHRFTDLENELLALELTALRVAGGAAQEAVDPASSVLKLHGTRLSQAVTELVVDMAGPAALASGADDGSALPQWARRSAPHYLNERKTSIYGGSNEVQRTIIAATILGL
ncbi:acyl-CoA dehydrogenase family protein [Streptomyces sp. NPDC005648]|uniref:acyl-CoA dehydrogenase family protein n=1 Tax=Streptomyces sp. NPDC005648 TaxID=3157044 RepID=UPI0033B686B3